MPWLIKHNKDPQENLFFVHVPRCGGTSLTQHFDVPRKTLENRSWFGQLGMHIFFHRYKLLETANFPYKSRENYILWTLAALSLLVLRNDGVNGGSSIVVAVAMTTLVFSLVLSFSLTFIATAPVIGRVGSIHRGYLYLIHDVLLRFMESIEWCTGTNNKGYMMHLTSAKLLAYGYVEPDAMESVCSMAIVRNPYSRMVSIYMYNRFGSTESFSHFVKSWYDLMIHYRTRGECEEYYTPCHCLPQFEFTHFKGKQLVQSIVKQEELKYLKTKDGAEEVIKQDSSVADLPDPVRNALLGMPHTNKRKTDKKWWDYYDQSTLDMTYELYAMDFEIFEYSIELKQRPDLKSPMRLSKKKPKRRVDSMIRNASLLSKDKLLARKSSIRMTGTQYLSQRALKELQDEYDSVNKEEDNLSVIESDLGDGRRSSTFSSPRASDISVDTNKNKME